MAGKFITFEGGEGTGKSTQLKLLASWLRAKGIDCLESKEPGGTEVGQEIRSFVILCRPPHSPDPKNLAGIGKRAMAVKRPLRRFNDSLSILRL